LLPVGQLEPVFLDFSGFIQEISHGSRIAILSPLVPGIRSGDLTVALFRRSGFMNKGQECPCSLWVKNQK
jgi:hypothetical protein